MRPTELINMGKSILFGAIVLVTLALIMWTVVYKFILKKSFKKGKLGTIKELIPKCLLGIVIVVIVSATLISVRGRVGYVERFVLPFVSYKLAWFEFNKVDWRNIVLNILMFVPFGFILPLAIKKLQEEWKVYLAGFSFSLFIELIQLVTGRGIFECDDLINNLLGTMIGYGLYKIFKAVISKKFSKGILLYQIPLLVAVLSLSVIFIAYNNKEYGNFVYDNTSKHKMPEIKTGDNVILSSEQSSVNVYKTKIATPNETREYAEELLAIQNKKLDEDRIDLYNDEAFYWSDDNPTILLDISYIGETVDYTNFDYDFGNKVKYMKNADEGTIREAAKKIGFNIPKQADLDIKQNDYLFTVKDYIEEDKYYNGTVNCRITEDGIISSLHYMVIEGDLYKSENIISSEEAFELFKEGIFYYPYVNSNGFLNEKTITVNDIRLSYMTDTKGYIRPIWWIFINNDKYRVVIPAMQK
ncbi:MAG: VanZ family protein [Lachnospiraceae bacterium]|nr:VanZ family protein [Lachnospiraceae bacterium]